MTVYILSFRDLNTIDNNKIVLPHHIGKKFVVHDGMGFSELIITKDMLYHKIGEFAKIKKASALKKRKNRKRKKK